MREILFRGKRVDDGGWIHGSLINPTINNLKTIIVSWNGFKFEVTPESVGQFTGLTDKNGTKIFEGDYISNELNPNGFPLEDLIQCYEMFCDSESLSSSRDWEITGNIHDK